jgi:hypothetical protein
MVKHMLDTRWSDEREVGWCRLRSTLCIKRWGAWVSWFGLKIKVDGLLGLCLKTGSSSLVIWASKSPRQFFSFGLKIKWAMVYRLRHKIDGRRTAWDTCRDLAACLAWKQVELGFSVCLKTNGGATAGGTRGIISKITWRWSQRRTSWCDGLHQTLLPLICCFHSIRL